MSKYPYEELLASLKEDDLYRKTILEEIMKDQPKGGKRYEAADRFSKGLPSLPIWCSSTDVPLTRKNLDMHYYRRHQLLTTLIDKPLDKSKKQYEFLSDFWNYLYINEDCLCGLVEEQGKTKSGRLNNIKLFGKGKVGEAFLISEPATQKNFILKAILNIGTSMPRIKAYKVIKGETNPIVLGAQLESQNAGEPVFVTAGMTNFANQTVMHMLMNLLLGESLNYVYQYDAFICKNVNGYNIMETASEGDMSNYINSVDRTDEALIAICDESIRQLFPVLAFLKSQEIGFCHNDLKAKNVFVNRQAGHVSYKLADFDKSSITFRGVRFYNNDNGEVFVNNYVKIQPGQITSTLEQSSMSTFTHKYEGSISNAAIMFNPYGYYLTQDFYTFILSLLFEKKINQALKKGRFDSENSLFVKTVQIMDTISKGAISKLIDNPPSNGESLTVINGVMHANNLTILNNVNELMKALQLEPYKPDEEFRKLIKTKREVLIGETGGLCVGTPRLEKGYFTKGIVCDTLPYQTLTRKFVKDNLKHTQSLIDKYGLKT